MNLTETANVVVVVVAALAALGVAVKWFRGGFKAVEDLSELRAMTADIKLLVTRELNHNHGSSMKDDAYGTAISVNLAHQRIDGVYDVLHTFAEANHLVLPIIADAIRATPPKEESNQ